VRVFRARRLRDRVYLSATVDVKTDLRPLFPLGGTLAALWVQITEKIGAVLDGGSANGVDLWM
jgi:hypothetical protein